MQAAESVLTSDPSQAEAATQRAAQALDLFKRTHEGSEIFLMFPVGGVLLSPDGQIETTLFASFGASFDWSAASSLLYEVEEMAEEAREWWPQPDPPGTGVSRAIWITLSPVARRQRVDAERRPHTHSAFGLMTWIFKAIVEEKDRHSGRSEEPSPIFIAKLVQVEHQLARAKLRLDAAMQRSAQTRYWYGAVLGVGGLALICALIGGCLLALSTPAFYGVAVAAGGIGAMVSLLQRMSSGRLRLDTTGSRDLLVLFGAVRPLIGAVFGIVIAAAILGGLLPAIQIPKGQSLAFFAAIGFLAGFNERWAQDMLKSSAGRLQPGAGEAEQDLVPVPSTNLRNSLSQREQQPPAGREEGENGESAVGVSP